MTDIKGINPEQINKMLADFGVNQNGKANVENLVNSIFDYYGAGDSNRKDEMTDLFERYAKADGNAELSAAEYDAAMNSDKAKEIISEISGGEPGPYSPATPVSNIEFSGINKDDYDGAVESNYRNYPEFINQVYKPAQEMLDTLLKYAATHNGSLEGAKYVENKYITDINVYPRAYFYTKAESTLDEGKSITTRTADAVGLVLTCEYKGKRILIQGTSTVTDTTPWKDDPRVILSYTKEDLAKY